VLSDGEYVFFFQAEDGIRDRNVTGVQTCALPISAGRSGSKLSCARLAPMSIKYMAQITHPNVFSVRSPKYLTCLEKKKMQCLCRSEERRVGKEGRDRMARWHGKEKQKTSSCQLSI